MNTISQQVLDGLNTRPPEEKNPRGELGQDEFLELMIAQIQHQDPFEPMDNGEFIAQMAQFSMVDGIQNMEGSIDQLSTSMTSSQALTATSLVGRSVMAEADQFTLEETGEVGGLIVADPAASVLVLDVFNQAGALVARREINASSDGLTRFGFDGRDDTGARLPPGQYHLSSQALVGNEPAPAQVELAQRINSVTIGAGLNDLQLNLNSGESLNFSSVREFL